MSLVKDYGNHGDCKKRNLNRIIIYGVVAVVAIVLIIFTVWWLALHPSKPRFYLQDASVHQFNLTDDTDLLTAIIQVTLLLSNPNHHVGIYYDYLHAAAFYRGQQITAPTALPAGFQGYGDVVVRWPYLYGAAVPVGPYLSAAHDQDAAAGLLALDVRVEGSLQWKVGALTSVHHHLRANCPVFVSIDHGNESYGGAPPSFQFQQATECCVDV